MPAAGESKRQRLLAERILDSAGNIDVYKIAIKRLASCGTMSEAITEPTCMDWRAERNLLQKVLTKINLQGSYVPRAGELVLWLPSLPGELAWNSAVDRIQIFSPETETWLGDPDWRAGVVSQVPEEDVVPQDLVEDTKKSWAVNYSGFRVETFPDPNSDDKTASLHYKYVPLRCIRPFNYFDFFCQGIPNLHASIQNAMTVMSSFSLLDKFHFEGSWPNASIFCSGIFLGSELLLVGDAVRLRPRGYTLDHNAPPEALDVMVIDTIRLQLTNCINDAQSEQLAESYEVRIQGSVYTRHKANAAKSTTISSSSSSSEGAHGCGQQPPVPLNREEVIQAFNYVGMEGYGDWYRVHAAGATVEVSQDMIIGRCYEPEAMHLLFRSHSLHQDVRSVLKAREYSRQTDERMLEGKHWFWGDYRTETLALYTLNGEDLSHYNNGRDLSMWQANLKLIDGTATAHDVRDARILSERGRMPVDSQHGPNFAQVRKTSTLVSTGLGGATDQSNQISSGDELGVDDPHRSGLKQKPKDVEDDDGSGGVGGDGDGDEESEESEEDDFSKPLPYIRGGTEETELGDYVPDESEPVDSFNEAQPRAKRQKHKHVKS